MFFQFCFLLTFTKKLLNHKIIYHIMIKEFKIVLKIIKTNMINESKDFKIF